MHAACPCPHTIQLLQVAANAPRQLQVLFPLHQQVLWPQGHVKCSRGVDSCVRALAQKSCMSLTARRTAHPTLDSLPLIAHLRHANARILSACFSPPSSQPSPRSSLLGSRNCSATSLAQISGTFRSHPCSRNTSTGSGSGSSGSSRHNSHVSVSSASLALGRARAHSLIQGIGGASRSSIELVLGHMPSSPPATGAVCLGDMSDVDRSEGVLSNPESHMFGLPVVGSAGSLLPQRAGVHSRTLESDPGRLSVSVSSSTSAAATAAVAAVMSVHARSVRGQVASPEPRSSSSCMRSSTFLSSEEDRQEIQQLHLAHSFGSQGSQQQQQQEEVTLPSPSILSQSLRSEDTTSRSTTTQTVSR